MLAFAAMERERREERRSTSASREDGGDDLAEKACRIAVESLPFPAAVVSKNSTILNINGAFETFSGWKKNEVERRKTWRDLVKGGPSGGDDAFGGVPARPHTAPDPYHHCQLIDRSGRARDIRLTLFPVNHHSDRRIAILLDAADHDEAALPARIPAELLRSFLRGSVDPLFVLCDYRVLDFNDAAARALGRQRPEQLMGINPADLFPPVQPDGRSSLEKARELYDLAVSRGSASCEWLLHDSGGNEQWAEISLTGVAFGRKTYVFVVAKDIFDRKAAEKDLRELRECYTTAIESSNDGILIIQDGRYVHANKRVLEMLGFDSLDEVKGTRIEDHEHLGDRQAAAMHRRRNNGEKLPSRYEITRTRRDGKSVTAEVSVMETTYGGELAFLIHLRDISRAKQTEKELKESERKFRHIFENTVEGVFQSGFDKRFVSVNPSLARMLAFDSPEQMIEEIDDIESQVYVRKEDRRRMVKLVEEHGILKDFEIELKRRDGKRIWVSTSFYLSRDDEGRPLCYEGTAVDITDRREWEKALRAKERKLELKSRSLEEANTALRVLLECREEDRKALEKRIRANFRELVLPYVEKVRGGRMDKTQSEYLAILERNLNDILSPFLGRVREACHLLTPAELQVADFIRAGRSSKEIARLLGITRGTADNHRNSIRDKLGLRNKKINLRTYLLSLELNV